MIRPADCAGDLTGSQCHLKNTNTMDHIGEGQVFTVKSLWVRWRLKSPASPLFAQLLVQAQIKENIKAPCRWPFCGEFTGDR